MNGKDGIYCLGMWLDILLCLFYVGHSTCEYISCSNFNMEKSDLLWVPPAEIELIIIKFLKLQVGFCLVVNSITSLSAEFEKNLRNVKLYILSVSFNIICCFSFFCVSRLFHVLFWSVFSRSLFLHFCPLALLSFTRILLLFICRYFG